MRARSLPRLEAERVAYEIVLVEFLNRTYPNTASDRCACCGRPETPDATLLPIGVGARHAWLHDDCWAPWREAAARPQSRRWRLWGSGSLRCDRFAPLLETVEA